MSNQFAIGLVWLFVAMFNLLLVPSSMANNYRDVGDPISTIYSVDEHQSGSQVWWIDQLDDGQMVFATANGLSTWDGEKWQRATSPSNTRMRSLSIWHDGHVYAGATNELGYFVKGPTGEFRFTSIPTAHLIAQFGQTRSVNSNADMVAYNTDECLFVWNGTRISKLESCVAKGSRIFNINGDLFVNDSEHFYQIVLTHTSSISPSVSSSSLPSTLTSPLPMLLEKTWQFPQNIIIKSLFMNALEQIIMVTNMNGIFRLEDDQFIQVVSPQALPVNALNSGIQGVDKHYYVNSTINGVMVLSENFELLRHYKQNDGLGLATTYDIFQDKQNNIWLAGLPSISVFQPPHLRSQYRNDTGTLDFENIYNINGRMFFSGTGFYQLTYPEQAYLGPIFNKVENFDQVVLDIVAVGNELLVGTDRGVYSFEFNSDKINSVPHSPTKISTNNFVSDLAVLTDQSAVFASIGNHLSKFEKRGKQWHEMRLLEDKSSTEYLVIEALDPKYMGESEARENNYAVWVSTDSRDLYRVSNAVTGANSSATASSSKSKSTNKTENALNNAANNTSNTTSNNRIDNTGIDTNSYDIIHFAKQDNPLGSEHIVPFIYANTLMIGTENGVYSYQENAPEVFTQTRSLPLSLRTKNKDVFKVLADDQARLWYHAGRDTGLVYGDQSGNLLSQEDIFKPYNNSGTRGLAYSNKAIWFGVTNGSIYRMSEDVIGAIPAAAQVAIRFVNDIDTGQAFSIMGDAKAIPNDRNSIRIAYALPDYSATRKAQYRTKISGQGQSNWTLWSNEANKDFTLLAGGDYRFAVEAIDPWGRISSASYTFSVEYPWYLSFVAWLCYATALILLIVVSMKAGQRRRNKALEKQNAELETKVLERTDEITQKVAELKQLHILKDRFFANVSHEFRTPLTLTIGPLQELINKHQKTIGKESLRLSLTALSNAKKMLALVGQVLDTNRLELGTLPLRVVEFNVADLLRANADRFAPWAEQHHQNISCINCENPYLLYGDPDQIDKCVSNLLSNAIKYSGDNTHISIEIVHQVNKVGIRVSDNGFGLSEDIQDKVFERFFRAESVLEDAAHNEAAHSQSMPNKPEQNAALNNESAQGSGIGLNLVKEITLLHGAELDLVSAPEQGCQFTLWFLCGSEHFTSKQLVEPMYLPDSVELPTIPSYDINLDKATVLIIDDNPSLRQFISQCLSASYQILEAENAEQGIAWALKYLPDIIISDVTMPGMSGLELTHKLKNQPETRSIPILLLSAQTSKRDIVAGFSSGANDYLVKPFDTSELVMRINALLQNYKDKPNDAPELTQGLSEQLKARDSFDSKLNQYILDNISNNEFSIDALAELMFMSKETLRRKCNSSLGMSPTAYVHQIRLQQGKLLLEKEQLNVSEVAYAVGFDSLAYFSRAFKKHYGVTPSALTKRSMV